jgi:xanthine dehydrogenase accessory factor
MISKQHLVTNPVRAELTDDPTRVLDFAVREFAYGDDALATLTEIRGGSARALGAQMAVAGDGRYCGYVSGGCVEAAVAAEALEAITAGCDRSVMLGAGSRFFDIDLPCGGGITIAIHVLNDIRPLKYVLSKTSGRGLTALGYCPNSQTLQVCQAPSRSGWFDGAFMIVYRPRVRLLISGNSIEADTVARLGRNANFDVGVIDRAHAEQFCSKIDRATAVVLLHHDLEAELPILEVALRSEAFYLGALGSTRTHRKRCERLHRAGFLEKDTARIKAPIGMFGPTKESIPLALSILADISATNLTTFA